MIKTVDVDELFDNYISDYVYSNIGKVKPEEIESKIPELYSEFGKKALKELDGFTPETYYSRFSGKELLECLKNHLESGVAVSDFLCEAITGNKKNEATLLDSLDDENSDEFTLYVMNMLFEMGSTACAKRYIDFIAWDYSEGIIELATEALCTMAESVKEEVLSLYKECGEDKKPYLTEILSHVKNDDRVFDVLTLEFVRHEENVPLYASYLARYGDERAIPFLVKAIEKERISYADFEELRFTIESLGGSYDKKRDFTADKTYKKIKGVKK